MTREEAIKICTREKDCVQGALDACADGGHYVSPDGIITALDYVEALDMAISAMREQGGSFQNGNDHNTVKDWPPYLDLPREEAIHIIEKDIQIDVRSCTKEEVHKFITALNMAIAALRGQEERSKACPYCDIAKENEGVRNTVLWVKEPETEKWTMMGKKLLFCPMCGRRLDEV